MGLIATARYAFPFLLMILILLLILGAGVISLKGS